MKSCCSGYYGIAASLAHHHVLVSCRRRNWHSNFAVCRYLAVYLPEGELPVWIWTRSCWLKPRELQKMKRKSMDMQWSPQGLSLLCIATDELQMSLFRLFWFYLQSSTGIELLKRVLSMARPVLTPFVPSQCEHEPLNPIACPFWDEWHF